MDDDIELGRIAQAPQWCISSAVVATMNELQPAGLVGVR